jgi:preprotein translocase subunit YajC
VSLLIIMPLLLVVMYVLMIRPQRQRQANQKQTIDTADVGDDVLTTGGIYGTITQSDGDDVVVEIAPGLEVHMTRRAIAAVLPPEEDEEDEEDDEDAEDEADEEGGAENRDTDDEEAVASGKEPVRSEGADEAPAEKPL